MELTIKNTTYPLKASIAFLNAIEKTRFSGNGSEKIENGLINAVVQIRELGDARCLMDVLYALNEKQTPRMTRAVLEEWIEETDTDLEALGAEIIDFLSRANVCKVKLKKAGILGNSEQNKAADAKA